MVTFFLILFDSRKNADDEEAKEMDYSNMTLEEKRLYYRCGNNYVTLDQVLPWPDYVKENHRFFTKEGTVLLMLLPSPFSPVSPSSIKTLM